MRFPTLLATTLLASVAAFAQQLPADKIIGVWESTAKEEVGLRFEIFKSNGEYFGKLLWASNMFEADGKTPKKDARNPNRKLRTRSRQNIINVINLRYEDGEYTDGELYNPDNGSTYSLNARLKSADELEFRGYLGIALIGKTMKFKRIP